MKQCNSIVDRKKLNSSTPSKGGDVCSFICDSALCRCSGRHGDDTSQQRGRKLIKCSKNATSYNNKFILIVVSERKNGFPFMNVIETIPYGVVKALTRRVLHLRQRM